MFVSRSKDVRYMAVWGYARLVGYNEQYELVPDILKDVEVSPDGKTYTFPPAPRPPLVERRSVHDRGLPVLVGGRGAA